jgi:hypothetical protein
MDQSNVEPFLRQERAILHASDARTEVKRSNGGVT